MSVAILMSEFIGGGIKSMNLKQRATIVLLSGILGIGIASCGDDDSPGFVVIPPGAPVVTVFNPPPTIQLGDTAVFPVEVAAPQGIRQFSFLQVVVREPRQTRPTEFIDPAAFGCQVGDTICGPADFTFRVGVDAPTGTYELTFTGFDQTGQGSVPVTVFINAFR